MTQQGFNTPDIEDVIFPAARIDAQDVSTIIPLREFLESHGVEVFVNRKPPGGMLYHIVAGDFLYVKQIFSRETRLVEKRLSLVMDDVDKENLSSDAYGKVVLMDPVDLTKTQCVQVFEFLFTGEKKYLDLRTHISRPRVRSKDAAPPVKALGSEDSTRINSIIADVFKRTSKKTTAKKWIKGIGIAVGILVMPVLWYLVSLGIAGGALYFGAASFVGGNIQHAETYVRVARYWIVQGRAVLGAGSIPLRLAGADGCIRPQERVLTFFSDTSDALGLAVSLAQDGKKVAQGLVRQGDVNSTTVFPASDIRSIRNTLFSAGNTLGLAQAELVELTRDHTFPFSMKFLSSRGGEMANKLGRLKEQLANMDNLLLLFSRLAGFKEPQTYLVLLQNNLELRPTGGFIGSFAIVTFEDGRLTNIQVDDVYTVDGQLKGHVDPPKPIRELLGQEHWYLRDSNWDPDFRIAGEKAAWFYEKETGTTVDGVIAVNTPFITEVLRATGPLELTDYSDRISADNFYGKAIYYTQHDFFPGSTQKKDFLGTLTNALMTSVTTDAHVPMTELFRALITSLSQHDIMMMFHEPDLQSLVEHFGWAGAVPSNIACRGSIDAKTCVSDPFIAIETNVGVNKINYLVTRSVTRHITILPDGTRNEDIDILIKNASGGGNPEPYVSYLRFVTPGSSAVAKVSLDDVPIASRGENAPPNIPYLEKTDAVAGGATLGIALIVPPSGEKRIRISLAKHNPLLFGPRGALFDVFDQKQPGVVNTPVHTIISYPDVWTAGIEDTGERVGITDLIAKQGELEYNTVLTRDSLTRIRFTK